MTGILKNFLSLRKSTHFLEQVIYLAFLLLMTSNLTTSCSIYRIPAGCELITNKDFGETQPLILTKDKSEIMHPDYRDSVFLPATGSFVLACPGSELVATQRSETNAVCQRGTDIKVGKTNHEFSALTCERLPESSTRVAGRCLQKTVNGFNVEVGFNVSGKLIKIMDICFNDKIFSTVYSHFVITPKISGRQRGFPRTQFVDAGFYPGLDIMRVYTRNQQRRTISKILGSDELGNKYVKGDKLFYLARGHLSAKSDFIYGSEQIATFYYLNVAPQWQVINAGNWATLEDDVRKFVVRADLELSVYTMPHGVAVLPDINDKLKELYLHYSNSQDDEGYYTDEEESNDTNKVPVPKFFIKILHQKDTRKGVAFVTINNPYIEEITSDYILCEDVCDKYPWLNWEHLNITLGYSYCCSYRDLRKSIRTLPNLSIADLL